MLGKNMPGMTEPMAAQAYEVLLNPENGLDPRAPIDIEGIATVLALRSEYAEPRKSLSEAGKYYDLQYHTDAISLGSNGFGN